MNAPNPWSARADLAQRSLDHFFGTAEPQLLDNTYPVGDNSTFNYWWLAHVIDVRLDAFARTGDARWLAAARATSANLRGRNGGSLFNDYFDDMLWYALALERLARATGRTEPLDDARSIWDHVVEHGWNDTHGASVAWRKQQLHYKNTPANGPFVILSARLYDHDPRPEYLERGRTAFDWITATLVGPDGFVEDGINREGDGRVDTQWRFTYNQGLYIGAAVALDAVRPEPELVDRAVRTATTALRELAPDGIVGSEGGGGDEGLFKGVLYRYLGTLLDRLGPTAPASGPLVEFVRTSTDRLWETAQRDGHLLAGDDWRHPAQPPVFYSTQLSAIMALELRAAVEARR
ncbi:glycoside hydrolase family 76 protein [Promicromonospora sp. NPDC050880]|uniref:glycoside hydrolase family 76 protein n=1 Tax=unclassified Promicromonospora TaxID=2647929 RepID=UPI0037BDCB10